MRRALLGVLIVWLAAAARLPAQLIPIPPAPRDSFEGLNPSQPTTPVHAIFEPIEGFDPDAFRFWVRCEYILGWVKPGPLSLPLIASGNAKDAQPGAIGQPNTAVLLGNAPVGYRVISGLRFEAGGWVDSQKIVGFEASGFVQEIRVRHFSNADNIPGTALLALPFFNQTPGSIGDRAQLISNPGKIVGSVQVAQTLQRWGTDANLAFCFFRRPGLEFTGLAGVRYEDLRESLDSFTNSLTQATNTNKFLEDRFSTRNQFFGGQVGGSLRWQRDVVSLDVTAKVALGDTHQVVEIQGDSGQSGPKASPAGTFPGGLLTQPSNMGRATKNPFTALPIMEAKLGYQITPRLRAFVGYDILYWNQVVRPGDQIDRNVNLTQSPLLGATKGVLAGPAAPAPLFIRSSFWAQDVSFGLEFRF